MWRVLLTDRAWPDTEIEREILSRAGAELIEPPATDEETLSAIAADIDAIATNWAKVTAKVIRSAKKCRMIARTGIGVDNIDVACATELGLPVTNCPDYCVPEVADHTLGLLLAMSRNIGFFHARTKAGEYQLAAGGPMQRLSGQTLGLFGLGRIGQAVAARARAFGLRVIATTSSGSDHGVGCEMVSFEDLLRQSDIVSLHAPATPATRKIINGKSLQQMKPTAMLINTSRGSLIDEPALLETLEQNRLAGAALDVFDPEPPDLSQPLFRHERVIVTPHAAFVSQQSLQQLRTQAMEQVAAVLTGEPPQNVVNPQFEHNRT